MARSEITNENPFLNHYLISAHSYSAAMIEDGMLWLYDCRIQDWLHQEIKETIKQNFLGDEYFDELLQNYYDDEIYELEFGIDFINYGQVSIVALQKTTQKTYNIYTDNIKTK